jgi:hypothetical protein
MLWHAARRTRSRACGESATSGVANLLGPGWNRPQDAVYPLSLKDANGDEYDGVSHNYVIHFAKGQLPPAQ